MENTINHHSTAARIFVRESKVGKGQSRKICGYAILFNTPSAVLAEDGDSEAREVIAPSAITRQLLNRCDIKFTMFHDRQLILARSNKGKGTLSYNVDAQGVAFSFDAPHTVDGDKALELVRRGDIRGCSFAFSTQYYNSDYVTRTEKKVNGKRQITYTVKTITDVYDFTLAADPAYPDTSVSARERAKAQGRAKQVQEMRAAAGQRIDGSPTKNRKPADWREQVRQMRATIKGSM